MNTPEIKELKEMDSILVPKPTKVLKTYSALSLLANILVAGSGVGMALAGAIPMDMVYLFTIMIILSIIGFVGRFIQQDIAGQEQEGPMGFKGLSIRFVWYTKAYILKTYQSIKAWFGK